jgi:lysophospholipase L1-like esterase
MKRIVFSMVMLTPLLVIVAAILYVVLLTDLPQRLYAFSIRNVYFDCIRFVPHAFVYVMKPGECKLRNIEYDTTLTHDADGFRNRSHSANYQVAVIGDSHAHGLGVQDNEVFSHLLGAEYHRQTRNLAIGSYATMRELEVLSKYGIPATYVIIQYCDNDFDENQASLKLSREEFQSAVQRQWTKLKARYDRGKAEGLKKILSDLGIMLRKRSFSSRKEWRGQVERRTIEREASAFAEIVRRYRGLLEGKRVIVLESSTSGLNSPRFAAAFRSELDKISWMSWRVIDTTKIFSIDDYYFLDDHPTAAGHQKLAAAIANEIAQWEGQEPAR